MNLPNKLTVFRIILVPVFVAVLLCDGIDIDMQIRRYIAVAIFAAASMTDALDGYIARKYNMVTNFGKFMDPLADKLLVCSAMIAMTGLPDARVPLPSMVVILIIAREFTITGFRTLAAEQNIVIAAGFWGKIKTITQMIMIIVLLLNLGIFDILGNILVWLSVLFTVVSAADYIIKNKAVLREQK